MSFAGLALAVPAASAKDLPGGAQISPSSGGPGTSVTVYASGCATARATASSPLFTRDIKLSPGANTLVGSGRISDTIGKNAKMNVDVTCADGKKGGQTWFTYRYQARIDNAARPRAAVSAGLGGSQGGNTAEVALGSALVAASALGGVALHRRRASGNF